MVGEAPDLRRPGAALAAVAHDHHLRARGAHLVSPQVEWSGCAAPARGRPVNRRAELLLEDGRGRIVALLRVEVVLEVQEQNLIGVIAKPAMDLAQDLGERLLDTAAAVFTGRVADHRREPAGSRAREPVHVELEAADPELQLLHDRELLVRVERRQGGAHLRHAVERVVGADPGRVAKRHVARELVLQPERALRPGLRRGGRRHRGGAQRRHNDAKTDPPAAPLPHGKQTVREPEARCADCARAGSARGTRRCPGSWPPGTSGCRPRSRRRPRRS